jgi:hypothetical protein
MLSFSLSLSQVDTRAVREEAVFWQALLTADRREGVKKSVERVSTPAGCNYSQPGCLILSRLLAACRPPA